MVYGYMEENHTGEGGQRGPLRDRFSKSPEDHAKGYGLYCEGKEEMDANDLRN